MRVLLPAYHLLAYYVSFFLFGLFGLVLNVVCLAASGLPATPRVEWFFQRLIHRHFAWWIAWLDFAGLVRFEFDDFSALPRRRGLVLVANHPGLMDVTYLLARCREAVCVFKPAIRRNPILGAAARRAGYLANDGGHDMLRAAAGKVAAGHTLIVFPEGTRSPPGGMHPLKSGFALVARRARAPIQLVRITCDSPLLAKGRAWWRVPPLPAHVAVTLGPCLPAPERDASTAAILAEVEAWFHAPAPRRPAAAETESRWQAAS
ncbi:MAG TPA: lysophospholipid acyltransferase family protein [Opitutaceae bacterium]|nr:lysophospholipid acyltransferase family protein [Opitutaceae bacterium]